MSLTIWAPSARDDLARLDEEFAKLNPDYALRVGRAAIAAGRFLARYPLAGPALDGPVRKWRVRTTDHVILYRLVDGDVEIVRLHHPRSDWRSNTI